MISRTRRSCTRSLLCILPLLACNTGPEEPPHQGNVPLPSAPPDRLHEQIVGLLSAAGGSGDDAAARARLETLMLADAPAFFRAHFREPEAAQLSAAYAGGRPALLDSLLGFLRRGRRDELVAVSVDAAVASAPPEHHGIADRVRPLLTSPTALWRVRLQDIEHSQKRDIGWFVSEGDAVRFAGALLPAGAIGPAVRGSEGLPAGAVKELAPKGAPVLALAMGAPRTRLVLARPDAVLVMDAPETTAGRDIPIADAIAVDVSPDGKRLASCTTSGSLGLHTLLGDGPPTVPEPLGTCAAPRFSPDGSRLAYGRGNRVEIRPVSDLGPARSFESGRPVTGLAWQPDGKQILVLQGGSAALWAPDRDEPARTFPCDGPSGWSTASPAGTLLLTATAGELAIREVASGALVSRGRRLCSGAAPLAISDDGSIAAEGCADGRIHIYEGAALQPVLTFAGHEGPVAALHIPARDRRLVSGGSDGSVLVWSTAIAW